MRLMSRAWPLPCDDESMLALVEVLRSNRLLGAGNQWGSSDELLQLSGGPHSPLAEFSLLMGPPEKRAVARQPKREMLPAGNPESGSPLAGKPELGPEPAPLRLEIEDWQGGKWVQSASHMGTELVTTLRTLETCTYPLPQELGLLNRMPALPGTFAGGLAYDLLQWTQPWRLRHPPLEDEVLAVLWRVDRWLIHDRAAESLVMITKEKDPWGQQVADFLDSQPKLVAANLPPQPVVSGETTSHSDDEHAQMVETVQQAITAGQLYQLNFGRVWQGPLAESPWMIMRRLARDNPAPFSSWLSAPDLGLALCSSSPELLMATADNNISTRPIKGTRPRGQSPQHDAELRSELLNDEKELAEHRMLVDLERNDIGIIAQAGSVEQSQYQVEAYAQVQHLVSEVRGEINRDNDLWSALSALFPGGSITGCPKTVTCAAIDLLEARPRSFWTGSIGYLDARRGTSAWNILIRTLEARKCGQDWHATVQAGGGLVIGSVPHREVEEAKWKAAALRRAAGWLQDDGEKNLASGEIAIFPQPLRRNSTLSAAPRGIISNVTSESIATIEGKARILFIDNLDSFAFNIIHACAGLGADVISACGLTTGCQELPRLLRMTNPTHIILGPGPGRPTNSKLTMKIAKLAINGNLKNHQGMPIKLLGICLGHQAIGMAAGMKLVESPLGPVHGVPTNIFHDKEGLFSGLASPAQMTRYNSLVLQPQQCDLKITAWDESRTLPMAFSHPTLPLDSVQFHPESCGSGFGLSLIAAFISREPDLQSCSAHN